MENEEIIQKEEKSNKLLTIIAVAFILVVLVSIWWMNTRYVYDKEKCDIKGEYCKVNYKDNGNWKTIIEEPNKEECKILEKEVKNQTNRWNIDPSRLIYSGFYSCSDTASLDIPEDISIIEEPLNPCSYQFKKEIELTCEGIGNKINISTVVPYLLTDCSKNTLNVNLTSYNNTFSATASCFVSNCEVKNLGCV